MNNIYYTPQSTTLEYIKVVGKENGYYICYFKFRSILRHFKYWIDVNVWNNDLEPAISIYEGLNIGKLIWSYILTNKIKEEVKFNKIMKDLNNGKY